MLLVLKLRANELEVSEIFFVRTPPIGEFGLLTW